jgi:two-component system, LytTR family, response regulator
MTHALTPLHTRSLLHPLHTDTAEQPTSSIPMRSTTAHVATMPHSGKIVLPTMEGLCFEKIKHITHVVASGNYTMLHFRDGRQVLVCRSLCEIEAQLPPHAFVRIHRSYTVHLKHLKKYIRGKGGSVLLQNGITLTVSAGQKDHFMEALKNYF